MHLHQLQVTYNPEHDRLLFRATFVKPDASMQEVRAWLTRRIVRNLWPGIVKALEAQVSLEQPQAAHAKKEIVGMAHQAAVSDTAAKGNFAAPFKNEAQEYPIGKEPILITAAHFTVTANQPARISFTQSQGKGFEIAFSQPVLHGFCRLLQDAVGSAQWEIVLELPGVTMSAAALDGENRVLN